MAMIKGLGHNRIGHGSMGENILCLSIGWSRIYLIGFRLGGEGEVVGERIAPIQTQLDTG